ncbi:MAG: potassium transporter Kup [Legionella sp.]
MRQDSNLHQSSYYLSLAALGVVFGDIGTSPLYAMRESLHGLPITETNIYGLLSLFIWSLVVIISIKYLIILFRADNRGEGGILSLLALLKQFSKTRLFLILGILGAGLLLGDGMLTPAISVISAIEGLNVMMPTLANAVLPLTILILVAIFVAQSLGTERIGLAFGPIILLWFLTLSVLGLSQIVISPAILAAVNPYYAIHFFYENGWHGYTLLGGVFLVVTGGEALYADLGHFGKRPIRISWFIIVLPSLVLNYLGQGAYLLAHPEAVVNPFYCLVPSWFSLPLLVIATFATIIASQAVITATFSLTKQAVLLGLYPHLPIIQTSGVSRGQVYIPQMNFILAIGTILLILTFRTSDAMASAYGIAVNLHMVMSTALVCFLAIKKWRWNLAQLILIFSLIGVIELAFLGANLFKLKSDGWITIAFALLCSVVMYTWNSGRLYLQKTYYMKKREFANILKQLDYKSLYKLPGVTTIFVTDIYDKSGGSFLQFLQLNHTLPENILIVNYTVENVPYIPVTKRFQLTILKTNVCELTLHYGFMDSVSLPQALLIANEQRLLPFPVDIDTVTYLVEIPNVVATKQRKSLPFTWQEKLFSFLVRNYSANLNIEFYQLPFNRTIAIGTYYII